MRWFPYACDSSETSAIAASKSFDGCAYAGGEYALKILGDGVNESGYLRKVAITPESSVAKHRAAYASGVFALPRLRHKVEYLSLIHI